MIGRLLEHPAVFHRLNQLLGRLTDGNVRCLRRALDPGPTQRVLDVGCGTGRYAELWGCRYLGVDTDPAYLRYARGRYGARFLRADAARLPVRDGTFDAAFCVGVLHHLDDRQVAAMVTGMLRVCRPGGAVVLLEPLFPEPGDGPLRRALARLERGRYFRRYAVLTALLGGCAGAGLDAWREPSRPFDLGLYRLRAGAPTDRPA
jgi:SAM-dependent methyltransferase